MVIGSNNCLLVIWFFSDKLDLKSKLILFNPPTI